MCLHILMITPDYPPNVFGGIGTYTYQLVQSLKKKGHKITVLVGRMDITEDYRFETEGQVNVYYIPIDHNRALEETDFFKPLTWSHLSKQMYDKMSDIVFQIEPFDIIHVQDYYHTLASIALRDKFKVPLITTVHSLSDFGKGYYFDILKRFMLFNSDLIVTASSSLKHEIETRFNDLATEVRVIPNGINIKKTGHIAQRISNQTNDPKVITYSGRLAPLKGVNVLLSSFCKVKKIHPEWDMFLKIIGDGPDRNNLETLAKDLGILPYVEFLGYKNNNEVRKIIRHSSLHVIPSFKENFPMVALEAMSEGTCVLSTNVGGLPEIVRNNWNGITVPKNDINSMAIAMDGLLSDPSLRATLSTNGAKFISTFTWERVSTEILKAYYLVKDKKVNIIRSHFRDKNSKHQQW